MNPATLEFALNQQGMQCLASFIAQLNREGISYTLRSDDFAVQVTISTGY